MSEENAVDQENIPFFKLSFSKLRGVVVDTNMDKYRIIFELEKFTEYMKMTTQPGEGLVPPPPPIPQVMPAGFPGRNGR